MGQELGGGVVEVGVQVAVVPPIDHLVLDHGVKVVEVDDDAVGIERAGTRHVQPVGVTVQTGALARMPGQTVCGLEREAAGDPGLRRATGRTTRRAGAGGAHEARR